MAKTKTVRVIPFGEIEARFSLAPLRLGLSVHPAVVRKDYGYAIRVYKAVSAAGREDFEYFRTDVEGNITEAPRGFAREFRPGRVPVEELDAAVARYAEAVQ